MLTKIKTINSHAGLARFLAEVTEDGWIPLCVAVDNDGNKIPSPYAYSPSKAVYAWNGKRVCWFETRHKHYEVFALHASLRPFETDQEATDYHIACLRG